MVLALIHSNNLGGRENEQKNKIKNIPGRFREKCVLYLILIKEMDIKVTNKGWKESRKQSKQVKTEVLDSARS